MGGLPDDLEFDLIEPLRDLFKDEVRKLGEVLGLPSSIVWRHPFPGPGLAVRVVGKIERSRLDLLRDCDEILVLDAGRIVERGRHADLIANQGVYARLIADDDS